MKQMTGVNNNFQVNLLDLTYIHAIKTYTYKDICLHACRFARTCSCTLAHTCMRETEVLNLIPSFYTDINRGRSLECSIFIDQFFFFKIKIGDKYSSLQFHNFGDSSK